MMQAILQKSREMLLMRVMRAVLYKKLISIIPLRDDTDVNNNEDDSGIFRDCCMDLNDPAFEN